KTPPHPPGTEEMHRTGKKRFYIKLYKRVFLTYLHTHCRIRSGGEDNWSRLRHQITSTWVLFKPAFRELLQRLITSLWIMDCTIALSPLSCTSRRQNNIQRINQSFDRPPFLICVVIH